MLATQAKKVWMDGTLVDAANAHISVLSHTFHYGVGVFEGIRCYATDSGPAIFRLEEHVQRLIASARLYRLQIPYDAGEIVDAIETTQRANGIVPSYIRPIVYRGEPALGVKNTKGRVSLAVAAIPAKKYLGEHSEDGVRAKISPFRKPHSDATPTFAKADGNYINSYLAGVDAAEDGYEEAILLDQNGYLAEGTGENLFLVRDGTLYTPGLESDILLGITRDSVMQIGRDLGIPVVPKLLSLNELLTADEVFFTGTYAEIAPVSEVSHYMIGNGKPGPVTRKILDVFNRVIIGREPKYAKWMHAVPGHAVAASVASTRRAGAKSAAT
ncbi:MAG: branched-chain amino acid transaminase [Thermoplasmata archaeon]|nr:branched-chain amino acid transaminase [Thermoplasmata archaeon]